MSTLGVSTGAAGASGVSVVSVVSVVSSGVTSGVSTGASSTAAFSSVSCFTASWLAVATVSLTSPVMLLETLAVVAFSVLEEFTVPSSEK